MLTSSSPSSPPEFPLRLSHLYTIPVLVAFFSTYAFLIANRRHAVFRHFFHCHVIMYVAFALNVFWILLHFATSQFLLSAVVFLLKIVNQFLVFIVFGHTLFLFFAENKGQGKGFCEISRSNKLWILSGVFLLSWLSFGIRNDYDFKFKFTEFQIGEIRGHVVQIEIVWIISNALIVFLLIFWFSWWAKTGRKAKLTGGEIARLVNSCLFVTVSLISTLIAAFSSLFNPNLEELISFAAPPTPFNFLPFFWIFSAFLTNFPCIQNIFQHRELPIVEFSMA